MSQKIIHRHIHKITLNEQKVAQFLFELLRDNFIIPKQEPIKNDTLKKPNDTIIDKTYATLKTISILFLAFIQKHQGNDIDEKKIEIRLLQFLNSIDEKVENKPSFIDTIKTFFTICSDALGVDLIIAILANLETREKAIKLLQGLSKLSVIIPFETLSLEKMVEKKFEKYIGELNSEIDKYTNRNYDISFNTFIGLLTFISIIVGIISYSSASKSVLDFFTNIFHQPFYYWIFVIVGYIGIVFIALFVKNFYEKQKRRYLVSMVDAVKNPLVSPELINHDYLLFIRDVMKVIKKTGPDEVEKNYYKNSLSKLNIIYELKFGDKIKGFFMLFWNILKDNYGKIILSALYFVISYFVLLQNV